MVGLKDCLDPLDDRPTVVVAWSLPGLQSQTTLSSTPISVTHQVTTSVLPTSKTGLPGLFLRGGLEDWMSSQRQSFEHSTGTEKISRHFCLFQLEVHGPRGATPA